jgi:hypothetical protein
MAATKYTPERSRAICEALELGTPRTHAAAAAGIDDSTFYDWLKHFPHFSNAVKAAEARCIQTRLERIRTAGQSGSWQADAWVLERRFSNEFGKTVQEQRHTNAAGDGPVEVVVVDSDSLRAFRATAAALGLAPADGGAVLPTPTL